MFLRTGEFFDKTSQVAEETLVKTKPKKQSFKDTKVSISVFSAYISKSKQTDRQTNTHTHTVAQTDCYNPMPMLG